MLTDHEIEVGVEEPARCFPQNPLVCGYHWVRRYKSGPAIPIYWHADWHTNGHEGWGKYAEPDREYCWQYLGPCPSPDEKVNRRTSEPGGIPSQPDPCARYP